MFDNIIENNQNDLLDTVSKLIEFPSVSVETDNSIHPFGENCTNALNYILNLGKSMGFRTKNIDNYCGYIEFGEGTELVGILGHLDVVPALEEDGWTTPPFTPSIRDGKIFGRGTNDDKGPVVAALYAMKAVKDSVKVSKRVRLILGLNEESGWKCIDYYKKHEEWPSIGFSPDANFPAIFAEKGIMSLEIKNPLKITDFEILEINCNNNAINVVPKYCSITLNCINHENSTFKNLINSNPNVDNISITKLSESTIKIESFGIAAHAARPKLGKNAIKNLVQFLLDNFEFDSPYLKNIYEIGLFDIESPKFMSNTIIEDESGILTSNVAILDYTNDCLTIKINLRIPVTVTFEEIKSKYDNLKKDFPDLEIMKLSSQDPLYIEKDSFLVKTLLDIFNKKTGLNEKPIAIGGGTYARAFKNCISYGITMPGDLDMCHQVNEFVNIDKLILSSQIYAEAIYELAK